MIVKIWERTLAMMVILYRGMVAPLPAQLKLDFNADRVIIIQQTFAMRSVVMERIWACCNAMMEIIETEMAAQDCAVLKLVMLVTVALLKNQITAMH